jgi:hypothetical protein
VWNQRRIGSASKFCTIAWPRHAPQLPHASNRARLNRWIKVRARPRFGQDFRVATLAYRSWTLWLLGYPQMALLDAEQGLKNARESGQAAGLMYALLHTAIFRFFSGSWTAGKAEANELVKLAASKGVLFWKAQGVLVQGCLAVLTKNASEGVDVITSGMPALHRVPFPRFIFPTSRRQMRKLVGMKKLTA